MQKILYEIKNERKYPDDKLLDWIKKWNIYSGIDPMIALKIIGVKNLNINPNALNELMGDFIICFTNEIDRRRDERNKK